MGALVTLALLALYVGNNPLLEVLELKTYDMRLRAAPPPAPERVAIAAIDEKSLAAVGRWPWSRATMARLLERLEAYGARVIVFDVFFSEAENQELLDQLNALEREAGYEPGGGPYARLRRALGADTGLAQAIRRSGKVVLSMVFLADADEARHLRARDLERTLASVERQAVGVIRDTGPGRLDFPMPEPLGLLVNLPALQAGARAVGHINMFPDADGTLRRAPLVIRYQGRFFPSGDVQAARAYLGMPELALHTAAYGVTGVALGPRLVPTDEEGRLLVRYYGRPQTVATVSAADVLAGRADAGQLRDRVVLVGATAKGIGDVRVTPWDAVFPGVEIRAAVIENLLTGAFLNRPEWMRLVDLAVLLALGALLTAALPRLGVRNGALLTALLLALYLGAALALFERGLWLNLVYPALLMVLLFMGTTIVQYFTTEAERRHIKTAFQHYVPAKVVDEIMHDLGKLRLGGEKRSLTVLFSDIRGFTSVAETLAPEELVKLLNTYLTEMTEQVFRHDGLLDKYVGDAILAVYGAPIHRPDHARLACRSALDMLAALARLQAGWRAAGQPVLDIGIGINSGPMVVGNLGSQARFDYTVIGDAVNLGSRIEGLNKVYGTHILLSEFTYREVRDEFTNLREIDVAPVRGRHEPVRLYELIPPGAYPHLDWLGEFARGYARYRAGDLAAALPAFRHLAETVNDPVSRYFVDRGSHPRRRADDRL